MLRALYFPPLNFHNTTLLVHTPTPPHYHPPSLGFASPSTLRMEQSGRHSPFFPRQPGIPSATAFTAELTPQQRFPSFLLNSTLSIVGLSDAPLHPFPWQTLRISPPGNRPLSPSSAPPLTPSPTTAKPCRSSAKTLRTSGFR